MPQSLSLHLSSRPRQNNPLGPNLSIALPSDFGLTAPQETSLLTDKTVKNPDTVLFNQHSLMDKVRVDKWLWAVRIFKSRTLAGNTVRQGKVRVNDAPVKPSTGVEVGDRVTVQKNGFNLQFEVTKLM